MRINSYKHQKYQIPITKITSLFIMLLLFLFGFARISSATSSNLLVNGDASRGLYGWTTVDNYWKTVPQGPYTIPGYNDKSLFYPYEFKGKDGTSTRIYQDVDIHNYVGRQLTLSGYVRTWDAGHPDETALLLELFDSNGKLLDKGSVSSHGKYQYHKIQVTRPVPESAVRARVSLVAIFHYGRVADCFFDNIELVVGGTVAQPSNPKPATPSTPSSTKPATPSTPSNQKPNTPPEKYNPQSNTQSASSNLLVNGGASNGLYGWTTIDNYWKTIPTEKMVQYSVKGHNDGTLFYPREFGTKDGETTRIYQDVDIHNYVGRQLTLSAYVRTWDASNTDETVLLLELFDSNGNLLDKGLVSSNRQYQYHRIHVTRTVPNNAVRARVSLVAIYHYGHFADCYFDDVELIADGTVAQPSNPKPATPSTPSNQKPNTPHDTSNPPSKPSNTDQNNPPAKPLNQQDATLDKNQNLLLQDNYAWITSDTYYYPAQFQTINNGNIKLFYLQDTRKSDQVISKISKTINISKYSGKKITLSLLARPYTKEDYILIFMTFIDKNNKKYEYASHSQFGNTQWQRVSETQTVPNNAKTVEIILEAHYNGAKDPSTPRAYFDQVQLTVH